MDEIKQLTHELKYKNPWLSLYEDKILRSNGKEGIYGIVEKPDFAVIIPVDGDNIYLVDQYRYPLKERTLEFVQGTTEGNETPEENARRELKEETGLTAGTIRKLGIFYVAVGFANQKAHVFVATDLKQTERKLDAEENDLVCKKIKVSDFEKMISSNQIKDSGTIAAWTLYKNFNEKNSK